MKNSKKRAIDGEHDSVNEPTADYKIIFTEKLDPKNTDEQEILLLKLLEKGLEQSRMGLGRPHEEVWAEMKLKYNFK